MTPTLAPRRPCTCTRAYALCRACAEDGKAQPDIAHPGHTWGKPTTTQALVLQAMHPPGSWHRPPAIAEAVKRKEVQIYALLANLYARGRIQRRGPKGGYEYAILAPEG
jgi:hypothetical protein